MRLRIIYWREEIFSSLPAEKIVFLEKGKIIKGLIKKSYPAQGLSPRAE